MKSSPTVQRLRMKRGDGVTRGILRVIAAECPAEITASLLSGIQNGERLERRLLGRQRRGGLPPATFSLCEQDRVDRLVTMCNEKLQAGDACRLLLSIGDTFAIHGEHRRAEELFEWVLQRAAAMGDRTLLAEASLRRGEVFARRGLWKQSTADLERSRALFADLGTPGPLARVENILGTNSAEQGKLREAVAYFQSALTLCERTRLGEMTGIVQMNLGIVNNIVGNYDAALTHYTRARSSFEFGGDVRRLAELHHNTGMTYLAKERYRDAIREFNASHSLSAKQGNPGLMGLACLGKASACYCMNDFRMALELVQKAAECFSVAGDRPGLADAYKVRGMIHREMGSPDTAEEYFRTSLRINTEIKNRLNSAETLFELGVLEHQRRHDDAARTAWRSARALFRRIGATQEVTRMDQHLHMIGEKQR
jgi:tetratricopeptide (TPR) repeat protein